MATKEMMIRKELRPLKIPKAAPVFLTKVR